jgi:hypothetical protein
MTTLAGILRELYGLFVEDLAFAVAIVIWIALFALIGKSVDSGTRGLILFTGFAAILLVGAWQASRR